MAFDGIVVANLVHELREELINGRIAKIAQPEADELLLTVKTLPDKKGSTFRQVRHFRWFI